MALFQPRNRIQILREMIARVIARSRLAKLNRNSVVFHILAAAAGEDAEQYVQMARLRQLFSIDRSTGSDLDERAKEIVPGRVKRRGALFASDDVVFSRPGTTGTITIPAGSQVAAQTAEGQVRYRTTVLASILAGQMTSGSVNVVATTAGLIGNADAGTIVQLITRIPGVTGVTNPANFINGFDRETDGSFRARLKAFVQAISRGTPVALRGFAVNVILQDGRRVLFATVVEPLIPTGIVELFIDDGTGSIEEFDETFIPSFDTFVISASAGETEAFTTERPIRDDGSFSLQVDSLADPPSSGLGFVALTRGVDYELNPAIGVVELLSTGALPSLGTGYALRANYRFYIGLIAETQRIIDGDPTDELRAPGVRAAGIQVRVKAPASVAQSLVATVAALPDFDPTLVINNVESTVQDYINGLDIGADVIVAEIIERAMAVDGMFNFRITSLTGSAPAADQIILKNQVARINAANITLT